MMASVFKKPAVPAAAPGAVMRKAFAGITVGLALGAFSAAQAGVSVGGGAFTAGDWGGGTAGYYSYSDGGCSGYDYYGNCNYYDTYYRSYDTLKTPYSGMGIYAFFDAAYVNIFAGFFWGGIREWTSAYESEEYDSRNNNGTRYRSNEEYMDASFASFNFGVMWKIPIAVNDKFTHFPAGGVEWTLRTSMKVDGRKVNGRNGMPDASDFNEMWSKLGWGLDYSFSNDMFFRYELYYGIRLFNEYENDSYDDYDNHRSNYDRYVSRRLGHGMTYRFSIGYRL